MLKKINKPWGYEEILEVNKKFMFKKLFMKKIIDAVFNTIMSKKN